MTDRDVTVDAGVAGAAETSEVVESRLVLAHSSLRTRVVPTVRLLFLTVDTTVTCQAQILQLYLWFEKGRFKFLQIKSNCYRLI